MPATYRYLVEDIMSGLIIADDLPLNSARYGETLNRPGALTGNVPMSSPLATPEILREGQVAMYVERNGRIDWGGPVWLIEPSSSGTVEIGAKGWPGYPDRRTIRKDRQFTATDQFTIFQTLIADMQDEVTFGDGYDLSITVGWDALSGVLRDRLEEYRPWKAKNLGEALRQLAAVENGFDFGMRYTFANNRIAKQIRLFYPQRGRDTGFVLEFEGQRLPADEFVDTYTSSYQLTTHGEPPSNIVSYRLPRSAEDMAWVGDGWGDGTDSARLKSPYVDATKRNIYPPLDAAPQFSGVSVQATLDENTDGVFGRTNHVERLPVVTVNPDLYPLWGTYELGDAVTLSLRDGPLVDVHAPYRLVGYQIDTADDRPQLVFEEVS